MHASRQALMLEPGEADLVRRVLDQAAAAAGGTGPTPATIILAEVAAGLGRLLADPAPPLLLLRSATRREALAYARRNMPGSGPAR
jgi:hypothetical protein